MNAKDRLLIWLSREDFSQYGECYGPLLDALIADGFAQVHEEQSSQAGFISKGKSLMYRAVSLTEKGIAEAKKLAAGESK